MSWSLLLVAAAVVASVVVLAVSLQRVSTEVSLLRRSMRRARAAAAANDELQHQFGVLAARLHRFEGAATIRRIRSRRGYGSR